MSDRKIKRLFEESDKIKTIDEQQRRETINYLMQAAENKKEHKGIDRKQVILNRIYYMDKKMFWIQLLIEFLIMLIFLKFKSLGITREDIMAYTIIFSGMMGVMIPGGIQRSITSGMAELIETCYFNTKQMVVFQVVYSGIFSLLLLASGILFVGSKWQINLVQISLYILVPFVFTGCCCLGLLLTEAGRKSKYTFVVVGLFAGAFYMALASKLYIYEASALIFWGLALVMGICIVGIQLRILFRYIEKGEILCMN